MTKDILSEIEENALSETLVNLGRDFIILSTACIAAALLLKMRRTFFAKESLSADG